LSAAWLVGGKRLDRENRGMEPRWGDPEAPWWAKLRRAKSHISEVRQRVGVLHAAEPWSMQREPAGPDGWAYRFRVHKPVPADLAAATGDAVANMRAALDTIAYELARLHAGTMSDAEERVTSFPVCENKAAFEKFFQHPLRSHLYGDTERRALQCVQPFARADEMREHGVEPSTEPKSDLLTDHAYALNTIWNIDKHRRLPELAWAAEGPVWFEEVTGCQWRGHVTGVTLLPDGGVLGELHGPAGSGRPQMDPHYTIDLVLTDDPSPYPSLLVQRLEWLHQLLTGWVVPRIFIVADGNPPPMMIGGG
jgi:hypothetical protein